MIRKVNSMKKEKIGRNGIVIEESYHDEAVKKIIECSSQHNYELVGITDSPITGTKGNKEFLILITKK